MCTGGRQGEQVVFGAVAPGGKGVVGSGMDAALFGGGFRKKGDVVDMRVVQLEVPVLGLRTDGLHRQSQPVSRAGVLHTRGCPRDGYEAFRIPVMLDIVQSDLTLVILKTALV